MLGSVLQGDPGSDQAIPCPGPNRRYRVLRELHALLASKRSISFARH
jgi:hypothetical protein